MKISGRKSPSVNGRIVRADELRDYLEESEVPNSFAFFVIFFHLLLKMLLSSSERYSSKQIVPKHIYEVAVFGNSNSYPTIAPVIMFLYRSF